MHIQFSYHLTAEDYVEFNRAFVRNRGVLLSGKGSGLWKSLRLIYGVLLAGLVIFFVIDGTLHPAAPAPPGPPPSPNQLFIQFGPMLLVVVVMFPLFFFLRRGAFLYRRLAPSMIRLDLPRSAEITDEQITLREPGSVHVMEWSFFIKVIESPTLVLLFVTPRMAQLLPKRAFESEAALQEFLLVVRSRVGSPPVGFPVEPVAVPPVRDRPEHMG